MGVERRADGSATARGIAGQKASRRSGAEWKEQRPREALGDDFRQAGPVSAVQSKV